MLTTFAFSVLSLNGMLSQAVAQHGFWALMLVAVVIFAETGLVVAPFLPGDSLLFLTGTVIASNGLSVHGAVALLALAAVVGDGVNFTVGRRAAPWVMARFTGRWLKPAHLDATRAYFDRYGSSTIVLARFVPIVRTLAPFLAGAGDMHYGRFAIFNVIGAAAWVAALVYAGAFLGAMPLVRDHLSQFTLLIVGVSVLPFAAKAIRAWLRSRRVARGAANRAA